MKAMIFPVLLLSGVVTVSVGCSTDDAEAPPRTSYNSGDGKPCDSALVTDDGSCECRELHILFESKLCRMKRGHCGPPEIACAAVEGELQEWPEDRLLTLVSNDELCVFELLEVTEAAASKPLPWDDLTCEPHAQHEDPGMHSADGGPGSEDASTVPDAMGDTDGVAIDLSDGGTPEAGPVRDSAKDGEGH